MLNLRQLVLGLLAIACIVAPPSLCAQRIVSADGTLFPYLLTLDPVANRIYVSDQYWNAIDVIDGSTNQLITKVDIGTAPGRPVVNSVTNKIYTLLGRQNVLKVIDGNTFSVTTVNVGVGPAAAAVNPVTNKIYVANSDDNTVTVVDGVTLATTTVPVDEGPLAIAVNPVTNKIYVGNQRFIGGSTITVIDGATNHTTTFSLGEGAFNYGTDTLLVNPANNRIYAIGYFYLYDIDGATNTIRSYQWDAFGCEESIALNTTTNHVYAPDYCTGRSWMSIRSAGIQPSFTPPMTTNMFPSIQFGTGYMSVVPYRLTCR
jgi:YVTN family beta-propeller protein